MQKNYKTFINGIATIAIIVFLIIHFAIRSYGEGENQWEWESLWGDIGYTTAIVGCMAILFNCFIWRIPCIGRLLHTPDIRGEWEGKGHSSYNDNGQDFTCTLKIKQTFLQTHIHGIFEKSQSHSFSSVFIHNDISDKTILVYSYQNDPKMEYRYKAEKREAGGLNIHYGSTMLDIDFDDLTHLSGTYWNDRTYIGSLELTKKTKNDGE